MHRDHWTGADFDGMSFHDVHVHGFQIAETPHNGTADLIFDIDYILEWINEPQGFIFNVAQAHLRFHEATDLRFHLDYKKPTAGMCPFSLDGIERRNITYPNGFQTFEWKLAINWPQGELQFEAPGFTQTLVGPPHRQTGQSLARERRANFG